MSDEHQDYKWVDLISACELAQYPEMKELLQECEEYIVNRK